MVDSATSVLLQWGIGGIAILAEAYVIGRLYSDNRQLQKDKDTLQEARRVDAVEVLNKLDPVMTELARTQNYIADKLEVAKPRSR